MHGAIAEWVVDPRQVTFFVNSDKETNERKRRPDNFALRVPRICVANKAFTELAKNAQTAVTESPLLATQILAC